MDKLAEQLADAARGLGSADVEHTLEKAVALALDLIEGCDGAGVTLVRRGRSLVTPVATAEWVAQGDALQYELQEGPCMDAVWENEVVASPDLAAEQRWPTWGPRVVEELGVGSMLCIQLFTSQDSVGALNLYSRHKFAFDDQDDTYGAQALAAHVAVALAAAKQIEELSAAVGTRTVIGQAEGILMERFDIGAIQAFAVLRRVSSHTNVKLNTVAAELVATRTLPDGFRAQV